MSYLPKSRPRDRGRLLKITIAAIAIFLLGMGVFSLTRGSVIFVAAPLWRVEGAVKNSLASIGSLLHTKRSLVEENSRLRDELASLEESRLAYANFAEREAQLLELAVRVSASGGVGAAVLVHPPQTAYDAILIDVGGDDGLEIGDGVILPEGIALGVVKDVFANTSLVKIYSTPGERTNAVLERGNVPVILIGEGGGNFKLVLPRDVEVALGDRVIAADIHSRLIAVIEDVSMRPTDSFKEILARVPANIFNLRFVVVLP